MRICWLLLFSVALAGPVRAQAGRIGMKTWQLRAAVGAPHRVDRIDSGKRWLFKGRDEVWFYRGRDRGTAFSYGIDEGVVYATQALVCHTRLAEAKAQAEQTAAAMVQKGWQVELPEAHRYELKAPEHVFTIDLLEGQGVYCVAFVRMHRAFLESPNGRGLDRASMLDRLLAFHGTAGGPSGAAPVAAALTPVNTAALHVPAEAGKADEGSGAPEPEAPEEGHGAAAPPSEAVSEAREQGQEEIVPAQGGYTWVVASLPRREAAASMAQAYRAKGFRSRVLTGSKDGQAVYRVGVGWYSTWQALEAARSQLPPEAPPDAWPLRLERGME